MTYLASGDPSGGPDFKNLGIWAGVMINRVTFNDPCVILFKSLAPGRAAGGILFFGNSDMTMPNQTITLVFPAKYFMNWVRSNILGSLLFSWDIFPLKSVMVL